MSSLNELELSVDVVQAEEAFEMLRFWVADQEDAVMLLTGTFGDQEPEMWGSILADISRHCVRAITADQPDLSADEVRARIENGYRLRLEHKDKTSGGIGTTQ